MTLAVEPFDDSKLYESIFGENQRWEPGQSSGSTHRPPWNSGWLDIAYSNKEAADHLVDWLVAGGRTGPMSGTHLTYPIMALYRHYVEVKLKGLLLDLQEWDGLAKILSGENDKQPKREFNHQILEIWSDVRKLLYQIDASELDIEGVREQVDAKYDAIENRIKEFNDVDGQATSFRYPVKKNGEPTLGIPLSKSELLHVKGVVDALEFYLSGISCGVHETITGVLEALAYQREAEAEYEWQMYNDAAEYS